MPGPKQQDQLLQDLLFIFSETPRPFVDSQLWRLFSDAIEYLLTQSYESNCHSTQSNSDSDYSKALAPKVKLKVIISYRGPNATKMAKKAKKKPMAHLAKSDKRDLRETLKEDIEFASVVVQQTGYCSTDWEAVSKETSLPAWLCEDKWAEIKERQRRFLKNFDQKEFPFNILQLQTGKKQNKIVKKEKTDGLEDFSLDAMEEMLRYSQKWAELSECLRKKLLSHDIWKKLAPSETLNTN